MGYWGSSTVSVKLRLSNWHFLVIFQPIRKQLSYLRAHVWAVLLWVWKCRERNSWHMWRTQDCGCAPYLRSSRRIEIWQNKTSKIHTCDRCFVKISQFLTIVISRYIITKSNSCQRYENIVKCIQKGPRVFRIGSIFQFHEYNSGNKNNENAKL